MLTLLEADAMSQTEEGLQVGSCKSKKWVRVPAHRSSAPNSVLVYGDGSLLVL